MRNQWYGDNHDLVKWSILLQLAEMYDCSRIIQVCFLNESEYFGIKIDGVSVLIDDNTAAVRHFRDVNKIANLCCSTKISIFDSKFQNRFEYINAVKQFVASFSAETCMVFLDPDTGLQPHHQVTNQHVKNSELREIFELLPKGWLLVFYQHKTTFDANMPWINAKKEQFRSALEVASDDVKIAQRDTDRPDVVFFFVKK